MFTYIKQISAWKSGKTSTNPEPKSKFIIVAVPVGVSGMNTPTNLAGAVFGLWLKLKSPALAVGMLFHMIELVRLNHGRH